MKRTVLLACVAVVWILAPMAKAQEAETEAAPPPPPLAGLIIHGDDSQLAEAAAAAEPDRMRRALAGLDSFTSLDDAQSIGVLIRLILEAATTRGTTVALLDIEDGVPVVAVAAPGALGENDGQTGNVRWWAGFGYTYMLYARDGAPDLEAPAIAESLKALARTFESHAPESPDGLELMLDLENLRRAWPESLAAGPARRVVAVTGLANARKIHVHVPEQGAVRLAYSSRALPAEDVSTRTGPASAVEGDIGVRWPAVFDAGLRTYAVALEDEPREAFARRFQEWMSVNGGRLRGIIQAVEIAMDWSVSRTADDGFRTEVSAPVRQGIETARLIEAVKATLANTGFEVEGNRGKLALPEAFASAVGGQTLAIEVDDTAEPVVMKITIE